MSLFTVQIADFGLSRDLQNEDYYVSHGGKIPVKWTAPEALNYRKYSTASDVWSYGVLLYEIWAMGIKPFQGCTNSEVHLVMVPVAIEHKNMRKLFRSIASRLLVAAYYY